MYFFQSNSMCFIQRFLTPQKTNEGWREILIDIDNAGALVYCISSDETPPVKMLIRPPIDENRTELEISMKGLAVARQLAERVDQNGGLVLIADYGHEGEKGDTFRVNMNYF